MAQSIVVFVQHPDQTNKPIVSNKLISRTIGLFIVNMEQNLLYRVIRSNQIDHFYAKPEWLGKYYCCCTEIPWSSM